MEQIDLIKRGIRLLFKPEELVELRARTVDTGWRGLYFTDHDRLAEVVLKLDDDYRINGLYNVINPLKGRLIRERGLLVNPTDEQVSQTINGPGGRTASDDDIDRLTKLFVDCDTLRAPHLRATDPKEFDRLQKESATDEEKAASKETAKAVMDHLSGLGWPLPLVCDSGNGWHLLYLVALANTAHNTNILADCLKALKGKFDCETTRIDGAVYNPARLTRAYGSTTRKGTNTEVRPYRLNRIYEPKAPLVAVTLDQLLGLATESPSYSKHDSGDLPELADGFDPHDWIKWYEDQGAFSIAGEKEWQGKPILATDVCIFTGHHHSGAEHKSGFVLGDSFGYRCFSDDCEGKTIKNVFAYLREAVEDDGVTKRFKPYPKPVFRTDTWEELVDEFGIEDVGELDREYDEEAEQQSVEAAPVVAPVVPGEPEVNKKRLKVGRVKDLSGWTIGSLLRDPVGNMPKFRLLKSRIESTILAFIEAPNHEVLGAILAYFEDTHLLPGRAELLNWLDESTHPTAVRLRGLSYFSNVRAFVVDLKDDPAKEFSVVATELERATKLAEQRLETRKNYSKHLNEKSGDGDVDAFRRAERKLAQKELRSKGEIVGKPLQLMGDVISAEFLKDVDGANDEGKFPLGIDAIDDHSHIGLNGERCVFFYGPASVGKTTMLMTVALNAAARGKNGLILLGEHQAVPMMKTLYLMAGHLVKDDPEIGPLPTKHEWEGNNRTATKEDWERLNRLIAGIAQILPGYLGVENISAVAQSEEDRLGAVIDYIHSYHMGYPLDFVVVDPLDQVMPLSAFGRDDRWSEGTDVLKRIVGLSRNFEGRSGKGLMVFTSAQFQSKMQKELEKQQAKIATTMDSTDDVLISLMDQCSHVQYYTTISQDLDMGIGIITRVKGGQDGYLVHGRSRYGSTFKYVKFVVDPISHVITTTGTATYEAPMAAAAAVGEARAANAPEPTMEPIDEL